ncbi:MAG: BrnT family toxin [Terriglobales bacterium]
MRFEWDEAKNRQNLAKHGINFETAALVFEDPYVLSDPDRVVDDEERWQTIGTIGILIVLVAHLSWDEDGEEVIRLISARKASSAERKSYEAHKKSG